jgi:hypothetical protein
MGLMPTYTQEDFRKAIDVYFPLDNGGRDNLRIPTAISLSGARRKRKNSTGFISVEPNFCRKDSRQQLKSCLKTGNGYMSFPVPDSTFQFAGLCSSRNGMIP